MDFEKIVLNSLSELTGLEIEELKQIRTLNLFENGIIDSLSLIRLISKLENELGKTIDITTCKIEDFSTIDMLINLISNLKD